MDENLKDVVIAGIGILGAIGGTLLGIGLGAWLEGGHRHDAQKRDAIVAYVSLIRDILFKLEASHRTRVQAQFPDDMGDQIRRANSLIEILCNARTAERANELRVAMRQLTDVPFGDPTGVLAMRKEAAESSLDGLVQAARKELRG